MTEKQKPTEQAAPPPPNESPNESPFPKPNLETITRDGPDPRTESRDT